jgi:hypothetical protein
MIPCCNRSLKIGLEDYGFEAVTASNGNDGLMQYQACQGRLSAVVISHEATLMLLVTFDGGYQRHGHAMQKRNLWLLKGSFLPRPEPSGRL